MSLKLMSAIIQTTQNIQVSDRQEEAGKLLNKLLDYVKQCQIRYGGKTELATEFDKCVAGLCLTLEQVLCHGLRSRPQEPNQSNALKQVTDIVSSSLSFINDTPAFWSFIKHHLTKHEQERYSVLRYIWTDVGKGRAWIRSALNERSLERYLHTLLSNTDLLIKYYEDWAVLRDLEKSSMLPNMAAGLGPILFAISIDKTELNNGESNTNKIKTEPIINTNISDVQKMDKIKRKRVATQIISFDDDEETVSCTSNSSDLQDRNVPSCSNSESNDSRSKGSVESLTLEKEKPMIVDSLQNYEHSLTPVQHMEVGQLIPVITEINEFTTEAPEVMDENLEIPSDIVAVLTTVENKNKEEQSILQEKISGLTKENLNLKQQLRKYISAVQLLNIDSNAAHKALEGLYISEEIQTESNYLVEAKIYENKLVQVAEMHAELMEFNEHLQKGMSQKEIVLQRLRNELSELRGPLPSDDVENEFCETVGLVSICVPSAFLTGSGSEQHHVYQIYIRAGNDDWNIYRRYAQFYALHSELKKIDPAVANFDFPPKKSLGNKDANLVEDRRRRLQTYLRKILAHWPELGNCNSKYLLEQHLSFFRDQPNMNTKAKNNTKKSLFSSRRSNPNNDNHYTGL